MKSEDYDLMIMFQRNQTDSMTEEDGVWEGSVKAIKSFITRKVQEPIGKLSADLKADLQSMDKKIDTVKEDLKKDMQEVKDVQEKILAALLKSAPAKEE